MTTPDRREGEMPSTADVVRTIAAADPVRPADVAGSAWAEGLKEEILRVDVGTAAAPAPLRSRRTVLRVAIGAVGLAATAGLVAVLLVAAPDGPSSGAPGSTTTMAPAPGTARAVRVRVAVPRGTRPARVAGVLRDRLAAAGETGARVTAGAGSVTVCMRDPGPATLAPLLSPGRLSFYDFEASRIAASPDRGHLVRMARGTAEPTRIVSQEVELDPTRPGSPTRTEYVLLREPAALAGRDVASAGAGAVTPGRAFVTVQFTSQGARRFLALSRALSRRGAVVGRLQAFGIVLDDRIVSTPTIDFREYPDGIGGRNGAQVTGELDAAVAAHTAAAISFGPLPHGLRVVTQSSGLRTC